MIWQLVTEYYFILKSGICITLCLIPLLHTDPVGMCSARLRMRCMRYVLRKFYGARTRRVDLKNYVFIVRLRTI